MYVCVRSSSVIFLSDALDIISLNNVACTRLVSAPWSGNTLAVIFLLSKHTSNRALPVAFASLNVLDT